MISSTLQVGFLTIGAIFFISHKFKTKKFVSVKISEFMKKTGE